MKAKRKAAKISPEELLAKFNAATSVEYFSSYDLGEIGKIGKDISKVRFDFENCNYDTPSLGDGLTGLRRVYVDGGYLSFIGVSAGGDWEYPVFFIIYLDKDGKTFRAFVPKEGNTWNYDTNEALGNDEEADHKFLERMYKEKISPVCDITFTADDGEILHDENQLRKQISDRIMIV